MVPKIPAKYRPRGIDFLYEDDDVIVVNKQQGILTTHTRRMEPFTVENAVTNYLRKGNSRSSRCAYLVHRLDRETSGLLLFAKNEEAQYRIKENWQRNTKYYLALVHGRPRLEHDIIESYLAEDEDLYVYSVKNPKDGKLSRTEYLVLSANRNVSVVQINLLTGRKNQIRVHFAESGFPVVGDEKYGADQVEEKRLYLHAQDLAFDHPFTGQRLSFHSPTPPSFYSRFGIRPEHADW